MENLVKEFIVGIGALIVYGIIVWIAWQLSKLIPHDDY